MTKRSWFKEWGWVYWPISPAGWIITIAIGFFCFEVFQIVDKRSHSVVDTFFSTFPFIVPSLGIWNWIASKSCKKTENPGN